MALYTLNEYGYCWNNPMVLVDRAGAWLQWIIDALSVDESEMSEWLETFADIWIRNAIPHSQGINQMIGYVAALNKNVLQNEWIARLGTTLNGYFDRIVISSELYNGKKNIVYHI